MMHIPDSWLEYGFEFSNLLGPTENFIIEQCTRSDNDILLPNLCNGYIGMDLTTPWLFLDGIYSGTGSDSHRASIPSPVCWLPEVEGMTCLRRYTLFHFGMGVCLDVQTFNGFDLYTSTFVSRARPHLIVRCVEAVFLESHTTSVVFKPNRKVDWETPDFATTVKEANARSYFTGQVYQMEDAHLLPHMDSVYMISQVVSDFNVNGILLTRSRPSVTFLTTLSRCGHSDALEAFESALSVQLSSPVGLLTENAEAWLRTWSAGRIVLTTDSPATHGRNENWEVLVNKSGDSDSVTSCELPQSTGEGVRSAFSLSRCLIAAQYALLASFPDVIPDYLMIPQGEGSAQPLKCGFFGLSPSGLGRGSNEQDYQGHVFWDMDIWMLPWVSLLHPNFSELAFDYRHATLRNAELRAKREGLQGARFAWESARTGLETSPWDASANLEVHIVANVSIAIQQWLISTAGKDPKTSEGLAWYDAKGRQLLDSIARFWSVRVDYSEEKSAYVIKDVMPPDEFCARCDNSAYTNAAAAAALAGPARMSRLFRRDVTVSQKAWEDLSSQIWMPFDATEKVMLEYEGYDSGRTIKQADTILLSYPLMYTQSKEDKTRMIEKYAAVTSLNGPAMTWAMFCICAMEVDLLDRAMEYFSRCLLNCQMPFYVWTEHRDRTGAINFITGAGGFLQAVVNGFAGIRVCTPAISGVNVPALFINPKLAIPTLSEREPEKNVLHIRGISFLGRKLDVSLNGILRVVTITLESGNPLVVIRANPDDLSVVNTQCPNWTLDDVHNCQELQYLSYWLVEEFQPPLADLFLP